ncbi:hypothetical protein K440DRAFT_620463 [Wilcoxina mikolae CBS 423.85]|nr:hypothetical protein K440DRAFT_620463 [Wilcoxina mikolae CBS 423.85]
MLNIGSYSWFQECWRSKDIFFFLGSGPQERFLQNALQLYVVPAFPRSLDHRPPHRRSRARNELLFSLALVLIEIAFGERLFKIYEPKQIYEEEGDQVHLAEYDKAKAILDSGMLQMEMGVSYAEVVTRCFYCDFGILNKDLNEEDLQKLFYEMVVKKLEECLEGFGTI